MKIKNGREGKEEDTKEEVAWEVDIGEPMTATLVPDEEEEEAKEDLTDEPSKKNKTEQRGKRKEVDHSEKSWLCVTLQSPCLPLVPS